MLLRQYQLPRQNRIVETDFKVHVTSELATKEGVYGP